MAQVQSQVGEPGLSNGANPRKWAGKWASSAGKGLKEAGKRVSLGGGGGGCAQHKSSLTCFLVLVFPVLNLI